MNIRENNADMLPPISFENESKLIPLGETEDEAIAAVLASLGDSSNASVSIYKQGPGGYRDLTYLTECLPAEYSLSRLQDEFGGGTFRIHVREGGKLLKNSEVKVAERKERDSRKDLGLSHVQAQIAALVSVVEKLATKPVEQPQASRMDWLKELQIMRELFGGAAPTPRQPDPIDLLTKMLTLQKELGGLVGAAASGDSEPGTMTVLMKALETFGPAMQSAAAARQTYQPHPMPAPMEVNPTEPANLAGMPPTPPYPPPAHTAAPTNPEEEMLRMYIKMLIAEAQQDIDPQGYALLITQKLDQAQIDALLNTPDWFEKLSVFEPKVVAFKTWFSELRTDVLEILTEGGGGDTTGESQSDGIHHAPAANATSNLKGNT